MTIKEMEEKEEEFEMFKDCRNCGITVCYPGVTMKFTHLELAKYFIEGILQDMHWNNPRARMTIHNKDNKCIVEVGINFIHGAKNIGDGLYEVESTTIDAKNGTMDFDHCVKKIFELIGNEEAAI